MQIGLDVALDHCVQLCHGLEKLIEVSFPFPGVS